jgi:cysteine synthase
LANVVETINTTFRVLQGQRLLLDQKSQGKIRSKINRGENKIFEKEESFNPAESVKCKIRKIRIGSRRSSFTGGSKT